MTRMINFSQNSNLAITYKKQINLGKMGNRKEKKLVSFKTLNYEIMECIVTRAKNEEYENIDKETTMDTETKTYKRKGNQAIGIKIEEPILHDNSIVIFIRW